MNRYQTPLLLNVSVALILAALHFLFPQMIYNLFVYPVAHIAAFFLSSQVFLSDTGIFEIPLVYETIRVIPKCSAYGFFCVLLMVCFWYIAQLKKGRRQALFFMFVIPVTFTITLLTNSSRIVAAYFSKELAKVMLQDSFLSAVHLGVGVFTFLGVLIGVTLVLERITQNESLI